MSHHIVEAKDLHYTYPDGTPGLDGLSFRFVHGESVGIVGENGAGKSTLLLHLIGYLSPTQGTVQVGDVQVTPKTLPYVRRSAGMIFQDPDDQLFMPAVYEEVAFGPLNLGLTPEEVEQRVQTALETVGASHLRDRPPYHLSGGEKRAVAIASVLSMSPSILVMDEPTANLDPRSRRQVIELLNSFEHTRIIATHDLDLVLDVCTRTIVMHHGRIAADGSPLEVFGNEALLRDCHLEKPLRMQACPVCGDAKAD